MFFYTLRLASTPDAEPLYQEEIDAIDDDVAAMLAEDAGRALADAMPWSRAMAG